MSASAFYLLALPNFFLFFFFLFLSLSWQKICFNLLSTKLIISSSFLSFVAKHAHGIQTKKSPIRENEDPLYATWVKLEDIMLSEMSWT